MGVPICKADSSCGCAPGTNADVCRGLEIEQPTRAAERLDDDEKDRHTVTTLGGPQEMTIISEPGLYKQCVEDTTILNFNPVSLGHDKAGSSRLRSLLTKSHRQPPPPSGLWPRRRLPYWFRTWLYRSLAAPVGGGPRFDWLNVFQVGSRAAALAQRLFNEPSDALICFSLAPETVSFVFIGCAEYFAFVYPLILWFPFIKKSTVQTYFRLL
jgi:hypothetical protein